MLDDQRHGFWFGDGGPVGGRAYGHECKPEQDVAEIRKARGRSKLWEIELILSCQPS